MNATGSGISGDLELARVWSPFFELSHDREESFEEDGLSLFGNWSKSADTLWIRA